MKHVLPVTLALLLVFAIAFGVWQSNRKPEITQSPQACVGLASTDTATVTATPIYCVLGTATYLNPNVQFTNTPVFILRATSTSGVFIPTSTNPTSILPTQATYPTDTQISNTPVPPTSAPPTNVPAPTDKPKCNQGVGNGNEGCDPGNSNNNQPSNDEPGKRGN